MPSLCPRPRRTLTECTSRLRSGSSSALAPLSKARAIACALDLMGQRQLDLLVLPPLTIGAAGARPPSNLSGTCARPRHHRRPRHHDSLALTLTLTLALTLTRRAPSACRRTRWRRRLRSSSGARPWWPRRGRARRGARRVALPLPLPLTQSLPLPQALSLALALALALAPTLTPNPIPIPTPNQASTRPVSRAPPSAPAAARTRLPTATVRPHAP